MLFVVTKPIVDEKLTEFPASLLIADTYIYFKSFITIEMPKEI